CDPCHQCSLGGSAKNQVGECDANVPRL
ncbi:hypothetical protein D027_3783B, partial [Vibrio parahaemolyticus 861]